MEIFLHECMVVDQDLPANLYWLHAANAVAGLSRGLKEVTDGGLARPVLTVKQTHALERGNGHR